MAITKASVKAMDRRKPSRRFKHLTPSQKDEICALYASGKYSMNDIAIKFDKDVSTIRGVIRAADVKKGEDAARMTEKVKEKVENKMVADAEILAQRIMETKEEHYKMSSGLAKLTWGIIAKAHSDGRSMATLSHDMKALNNAANIFRVTRQERYAICGLSDVPEEKTSEDQIPELKITELTVEQIKDMIRARSQSMAGVEDIDVEQTDQDVDGSLGDDDLIVQEDEVQPDE